MAQMIDYLLIDISNSFTKIAFASKTKINRRKRVATERLNASFLRLFVGKRKIDKWVVCSVVPKKNREIQKASAKRRILWLGPQLDLGVGGDYPNPRSIGADRL